MHVTFSTETFLTLGPNTLGHIAQECKAGRADEGRAGPLFLPNLASLGLWKALSLATGGAPHPGPFGVATQVSRGKDTPSGHWGIGWLTRSHGIGTISHLTPLSFQIVLFMLFVTLLV